MTWQGGPPITRKELHTIDRTERDVVVHVLHAEHLAVLLPTLHRQERPQCEPRKDDEREGSEGVPIEGGNEGGQVGELGQIRHVGALRGEMNWRFHSSIIHALVSRFSP